MVDENRLYYYLALVLLAFGMIFVCDLGRTHLGRNMIAVRDSELAGAVLGINVARTKVIAFVLSSFIAGVAGAMYGSYLMFLNPGTFDLSLSVQFVAIIIVGGLGSMWGPVLGALFVLGTQSLVSDTAGALPFRQGGSRSNGIPVADASAVIYGLLLIVFLLAEPTGMVGLSRRVAVLARRRRALPRPHGVASPVTPSEQPVEKVAIHAEGTFQKTLPDC